MKIYHTLKIGSYNFACDFLEQHMPVTNVTYSNDLYYFYVGDNMVGVYDELKGILQMYVEINTTPNWYGKLW